MHKEEEGGNIRIAKGREGEKRWVREKNGE